MKILALEFSSSPRSVACGDGHRIVFRQIEEGGASRSPFAVIDEVLRNTGVEREAVECLAVGIGPGSYAGIRSAIALAQGWQLALGTRVCGINAVRILARQAQTAGLRGRVLVVIDAQRGELYRAGFEIEDNGIVETEPLQIATPDEVRKVVRTGTIIGPEADRWFEGARVMVPSAETLLALAALHPEFTPAEQLEPVYLRETKFVKAPPARVIPPV